jgi:hypothetical protein
VENIPAGVRATGLTGMAEQTNTGQLLMAVSVRLRFEQVLTAVVCSRSVCRYLDNNRLATLPEPIMRPDNELDTL